MTRLLTITGIIGLVAWGQAHSTDGPEAVEWSGTVTAVELKWTTVTDIRSGDTKRSLGMGIFQIRDPSGQERRVVADADPAAKVKVRDATGAALPLSDIRKGARVTVKAVENARKEGEEGLDYWQASEIVVQTNGPEEASGKQPPSR